MSTKLSLKSVTSSKKINSPLAKYNAAGQLFCVLCNSQIKNEMYWTGHVNGKSHRELLSSLKNKGPGSSTNGTSTQKRSAPSDPEHLLPKKSKSSEADSTSTMGPPMSTTVLKNKHASSSNQIGSKKTFEEIEAEELRQATEEVRARVSVPTEMDVEEGEGDEESKKSQENENVSATLPEGFFDDAKEDAKVRGLEYKNPEELEWEKFMKEIAAEEVKSSVLRSYDEEDSAKDRELDEVEEQMKNWQRVIELEKKAEEIRNHGKDQEMTANDDDEEDDEADLEYDEDLDWRTKKH